MIDLMECTTQESTRGSDDVIIWCPSQQWTGWEEASLLGLTKPIFLLSC